MKQKILFLFLALFSLLFSNTAYAQTLFPGQTLPDNIVDAGCNISPSSTQWSFTLLAQSPVEDFVNTGSTVLTGDIDGDGEIELIVQNNADATTTAGPITYIYIYGYNKATQSLYRKYTIDIPDRISFPMGNITVANVNGNKYASLFFASPNGYLYKYDYTSGTYTESWNKQYSTSEQQAGVPIVADFNNLGRAQVNVFDKIYDAVGGNLLVDAGYLGNSTYSFGFVGHLMHTIHMSSMHVGDIDGDGTLEIVGGDCVYKVTIADPVNAHASNKFELIQRADKTGRTDIEDGGTALVDMDLDGQLDVVVTAKARFSGVDKSVYVYNPRTGAILHDNQINNIPKWVNYGPSMPFVGDIDGDGYPEIALTARYILQTYKLDVANRQLNLFWEMTTTDQSSSTTLTLFDFNQTGTAQLVYRDEDNLRIIDGRAGIPAADRVLTKYDYVQSLTVNEYPTVADINGDGQAEIIVTGAYPKAMGGQIYVFSSGDPINHPWAPARSVWNTNAYNAVNVNSDLTIPKYQLNPATEFPGYDGSLATTADNVRPFNNFLQQQTILHTNGTPLWPGPEGQITGTPTFNYNAVTDDMIVSIDVTNTGDAIFQSPFYVTAYKDIVGGIPKYTHTHTGTIGVGNTETITFSIPNFTTNAPNWIPYNFIIIKINDNGDGTNNQEVCRDDKSQYRYRGILPTEQESCKDNIATMTCIFFLSGNDTYQWQYSVNDITWTDIVGATSKTYKPAYQEPGTVYYRVVVTNEDEDETVVSASVQVLSRRCVMPVNPNIHIFRE